MLKREIILSNIEQIFCGIFYKTINILFKFFELKD
jgi:hypothetical protein